jgi:hypothetical protein
MGIQSPAMSVLKSARGTPGYTDASTDRPREMNRYMGGHRRMNHPHVSGYWYIVIEPPHRIFSSEKDNVATGGLEGATGSAGEGGALSAAPFETSRWFHSAAESFTPPTRTLTKVDLPGLGGLGSSYVAGQQLTRTFSVAFREYQDTPIMNALNLWTSTIDHHYGVSPLQGNEYIPANYKGAAWVYLCKPTASEKNGGLRKDDIDQFFFFEGVFPEGAPTDAFNSDIATNDVIQISTTFSFDGWPIGKEHEKVFSMGIDKINLTYGFDFNGTYLGRIADDAPSFTQLPTASTSTDDVRQ